MIKFLSVILIVVLLGCAYYLGMKSSASKLNPAEQTSVQTEATAKSPLPSYLPVQAKGDEVVIYENELGTFRFGDIDQAAQTASIYLTLNIGEAKAIKLADSVS